MCDCDCIFMFLIGGMFGMFLMALFQIGDEHDDEE